MAHFLSESDINTYRVRTWLSGRASPCQGEGRGFDSRRPLHINFAPLAQLDRAFDYESKGREFESLRAHHLLTLYFAGVAEWQTRSTQNREGNRGGSSPLAGINYQVKLLCVIKLRAFTFQFL